MKNNVKLGVSLILVAMLLGSIALVATVSAAPEETMDQWMQNHTVNVESVTTYRYEQGHLEVKEIYTGKELEERFSVKNITKVQQIPIDRKDILKQEETEKVVVTKKEVVLTTKAYNWWDNYDYPQWTCQMSDI